MSLFFSLARPAWTGESPALSGLWCVNLSGDFAWLESRDLQSFYKPGTLDLPERQLYPGFNLSLRRFASERFFAALELASLPKGYNFDLPASSDPLSGPASYQWDALLPSLGLAWVPLRSAASALYLQGELGWIFLSQATFTQGGGARKGTFDGGALAEGLGAGGLWFLLPSVALELKAGYRWARMPLSATDQKGRMTPPSAPEFYVDYSGPYGRLGVSFFWGLANPWGEMDSPPPAPSAPPPQ